MNEDAIRQLTGAFASAAIRYSLPARETHWLSVNEDVACVERSYAGLKQFA
jgi:hypothetical protein